MQLTSIYQLILLSYHTIPSRIYHPRLFSRHLPQFYSILLQLYILFILYHIGSRQDQPLFRIRRVAFYLFIVLIPLICHKSTYSYQNMICIRQEVKLWLQQLDHYKVIWLSHIFLCAGRELLRFLLTQEPLYPQDQKSPIQQYHTIPSFLPESTYLQLL